MEKQMKLECLKAAASVAARDEVLKVAREFWAFVNSDLPQQEHPRTER